jgi:polyisoprenyl-phosphate glycosyltransferase
MKISLVIPVYNSETIIPELVVQIAGALSGHDYEVILVNDDSEDNSWEVMAALSRQQKNIKSICLAKNFGQDNAIMCGLHYATGDRIVIMDDDLQHSPYDILKLNEKCDEGYDVCYADYSGGKHQAKWKNIGSYLNSKQAEFVIGKPREIYLSPFKMISRVVADAALKYGGPFPYVDGLIFRSSSAITQIPVEHHRRFDKKSNYNLKKSISVFLKHLTGFSIIPLRIAALLGVAITFLGIILIAYYLWSYGRGQTIEGWTTMVVLQLVMGGAILMSLGVIGEYLGRLYLVANNRPQFIVREINL